MATHSSESPLAKLGIGAGFKTQTARAKALGVSRNYLMIIERGERLPSTRLKQKMIEVYGVDDQTLYYAILLASSMYTCSYTSRYLLAELQKSFWLIPIVNLLDRPPLSEPLLLTGFSPGRIPHAEEP
jgi:DNA-binding XRE family transcriptional regulator